MFKNRKINEGEFALIALILIVICTAFILLIVLDKGRIKEIKINEYSNENIQYYIDEKIDVDKYITIDECWAIKPNEVINTFDTSIVLRNVDTDETYLIPTSYEKRDDIEQTYGSGYNYNKSGFYSKVKTSLLDIENNKYEIIIKYNNNDDNMYIATGIIIGEKGIIVDNE